MFRLGLLVIVRTSCGRRSWRDMYCIILFRVNELVIEKVVLPTKQRRAELDQIKPRWTAIGLRS